MAMPSMAAVIRRCLAGDPQAQEELVLAAQNRVYYHCKKMLKHEEDALDATQEVLISMLTKLDKLQDPEAFWGWLSAMAANHCRNVLTRGRREAQIPEDDEGNSLLDAFEDLDEQTVPDKALDNDETRRMIVDLVDQLPDTQRQCVLMYYYEEMGVKDIANALGVSEGTVKSRLNYARKAIKAGVDGYTAQGIKLYDGGAEDVYGQYAYLSKHGWITTDIDDLKPGAVLFFGEPDNFSHAALYVGRRISDGVPMIIHATSGTHKVDLNVYDESASYGGMPGLVTPD